MDYFKFEDISEKSPKVAIMIPGLLIGFNETILEFADKLREALNQPTMLIYTYTWESPENIEWIKAVKSFAKKYPKLNYKISTGTYEKDGPLEVCEFLANKLNLERPEGRLDIDPTNFKRIVALTAYHKTAQLIYKVESSKKDYRQDNTNLILKLKPGALLHTDDDSIPHFIRNIKRDILDSAKNLSIMDYKDLKHPYDIFYSKTVSSSSLGDSYNYSSAESYHSIFGSNLDEFKGKVWNIYKKYLRYYPFKVKSFDDLKSFGMNLNYFPLEGSTFIYDMWAQTKNRIPYNVATAYPIKELVHVRNPWHSIKNGAITYNTETTNIPPELDERLKHYSVLKDSNEE